MSFTSSIFWIFLAAFLATWWLSPKGYWGLVLSTASLLFYGYWFPPAAILLIFFALLNYKAGLEISLNKERARPWLLGNIAFALGALIYFKYPLLLVSSLDGTTVQPGGIFFWTNDILLPLGLSFYTFRGLSYCIDVYKGKISPTANFIEYFSFLAYFPEITAGPITRAGDFFAQMSACSKIKFAEMEYGIYRILRGLFLKLIISDHIIASVNTAFAIEHSQRQVPIAWAGAIFFAIQIYCDFAGYSDIAIGISRLLGFKARENFDNPYFANSLSEFWRRWHISLSTWFRDYVYFPLARSVTLSKGVSVVGPGHREELIASVCILVMFVLSGIWHGANWTFLLWGLFHGIGILVERRIGINTLQQNASHQSVIAKHLWRIVTLFVVLMLWVLFRSASLLDAFGYWSTMFTGSWHVALNATMINGVFWSLVFILYQGLMILRTHWVDLRHSWNRFEAWGYFAALLFISSTPTDFIYLRF